METYDLRGLITYFTKNLQEQGKSVFTVVAYKKDLEQFIGYLASREKTDIKEVKREDIEGFINKLMSESYTKKSASRKLNSIRTFFRFLKSQNTVSYNPALEVSHPKYTQALPRILTKLEYRGLRDSAKENPRTYAMVELLLQTGIRIGELAELTMDIIKDDGLHLEVRIIPLNMTVRRAITQYLKYRHKSANSHLFVTKTGKPLLLRNIRTIIDKCFKDIDIQDATVNDLRNTFIVYQLGNGASVSYISKIVGHKRLSSTERYLQLVKKQGDAKDVLQEM